VGEEKNTFRMSVRKEGGSWIEGSVIYGKYRGGGTGEAEEMEELKKKFAEFWRGGKRLGTHARGRGKNRGAALRKEGGQTPIDRVQK